MSSVKIVVYGLVMLVAGLVLAFWWPHWWEEFLTLVKGTIPLVLFMVGLVFLMLGVSQVSEEAEAKRREREETALREAQKAQAEPTPPPAPVEATPAEEAPQPVEETPPPQEG